MVALFYIWPNRDLAEVARKLHPIQPILDWFVLRLYPIGEIICLYHINRDTGFERAHRLGGKNRGGEVKGHYVCLNCG